MPHSLQNETDEQVQVLVEGFTHEFNVAASNLQILKPEFDGRLGDPASSLRRSLVRYVSFYVNKLVKARDAAHQKELQLAQLDAKINLIKPLVYTDGVEYWPNGKDDDYSNNQKIDDYLDGLMKQKQQLNEETK